VRGVAQPPRTLLFLRKGAGIPDHDREVVKLDGIPHIEASGNPKGVLLAALQKVESALFRHGQRTSHPDLLVLAEEGAGSSVLVLDHV
jgi:hypothetical protein